MRTKVKLRGVLAFLAALMSGVLILAVAASAAQQGDAAQQASASKKARAVGTVRSINGNTVTLTTDAGADINVTIQPSTRLMRMAPGSRSEDRNRDSVERRAGGRSDACWVAQLVDDGKSVAATTAVIMKKSDVAEKQQHDREEWQKNGVGGVVKSVDAAAGTITLSTGTVGAPNTMTVHVSKDTIIRRYAPDSIKFDDAKPGTLEQIKAGDQLRARGTKSEDGKELDGGGNRLRNVSQHCRDGHLR